MEADYKLCPKCKGSKVEYYTYTYGYLGSYCASEKRVCKRCDGTGIILAPANSEKILQELLNKK